LSDNWVALFPGQGKLTQDFLEVLQHRNTFIEIYECACHYNNIDYFKELARGNLNNLQDNKYYAGLLTMTNLAALNWVREQDINITNFCGYSIGQYSAIYAAGALSLEELFKLVLIRSELMTECLENIQTGMISVIGVELDQLKLCLKELNKNLSQPLVISNYNCHGNYTVAGNIDAIEKFNDVIHDYSPRKVVELDVVGAWHSYFLKDAGNKFQQALDKTCFLKPIEDVVDNVTGEFLPVDVATCKKQLEAHIYSPVQWQKSIQYLYDCGCSHYLELGFGKTLTTFNFFINRELITKPISLPDQVNNIH